MSRFLLPAFACVISWTAIPTIAADPAPKATIAIPAVSYPRPTPLEEKIRKALDDRTELAFTDTPLTDAIDFLEDVHGITILVDTEALQDEGVDPSSPVNLEISGITLRSALSLLLRPLSLTTVIEDEVLKVTTLAKAGEDFVTRVYPVHDLAGSNEELASLISAIQNGVATDRWKRQDRPEPVATLKLPSQNGQEKAVCIGGGLEPGMGTITSMAKSRSLVVRHSQQVHEEIEALLKNLRTVEADFAEFARQHLPRTAERIN